MRMTQIALMAWMFTFLAVSGCRMPDQDYVTAEADVYDAWEGETGLISYFILDPTNDLTEEQRKHLQKLLMDWRRSLEIHIRELEISDKILGPGGEDLFTPTFDEDHP